MLNKLLSTTKSSGPSTSSPSNPLHEPGKTSSMKALDDNQVSSPSQGLLTKRGEYANVNENKNENEKDDAIPDLILPSSSPSEQVTTISTGRKDRSPSLAPETRADTMDDSIETILSQSMDLASFIKSLELQQEEKEKQQLGHNQAKNHSGFSFEDCHKSFDGSLSLAASQVDISLANEAENIQIGSDGSEGKSKATSDSKKSSNNSITENQVETKSDSKIVGLKTSNNSLLDNQVGSPQLSHSASAKNRNCNVETMAHLGERLFRESLKVDEVKTNQQQLPTSTASDTPEPIKSKGQKTARLGSKTMKGIVFAILIIALVFGRGKENAHLNDFPETTAPLTECDLTKQEHPVDVMDEQGFPNTLNHRSTVAKKSKDDELSSSTERHDSMLDDPTQQHVSNQVFEEQRMDKYSKIRNTTKSMDIGSDDGRRFIILDIIMIVVFFGLPIALFLLTFRLFTSMFSSSSSSSKHLKTESTKQNKTPSTPTGTLLRQKRDGFLTPPLSCKNRAQEPSEWMSPCYGDDAIDVSVYESMKHAEIRDMLRDRKCDTRGNKQQLIKVLVMSYQNELACLTVQQLRPKLRKRKLSQQGTKKEIVRRLVEAGPIFPLKVV